MWGPTVLSQINSGACYFRGVKKISARPLRRDDFGGPSQRVRLMRASLLVPLNFLYKLHAVIHVTVGVLHFRVYLITYCTDAKRDANIGLNGAEPLQHSASADF